MQITVNGKTQQTAGPITLSQLLEQLEIKAKHVAIEVNLELIPRQRHGDVDVQDGDRLEIVTLAGGG